MLEPFPRFVADLHTDLTAADRLLCVDRGFALGTFRARPSDTVFSGSYQLKCCYLVFPRTASEIRLERGPAAVHTPLDVVAYNVGDSYRRFAVSATGDASDYIALDHAFVRGFLADEFGDLPQAGGDLLFNHFSSAQTRSLFLRQRRLFDRLLASPAVAADAELINASAIREEILELLLATIGTGVAGPMRPPPLSASHQRAIAEDVKRQMSRRFCDKFDLDELAMLTGVSSGHLARIFRRQTGLSIHQFMIELRLRESLDLLLEMRSIADVAAQLGFTHHSHFTAAFGKAFGTTPSAYIRAAPRRSGRRWLKERLGAGRTARIAEHVGTIA
jgi:AraC-like DNA-binding protein